MALESLKLEGLELNDGTSYSVQSLTFTPAQKLPQFATNSDADGEVLVQDPHYTNSYFEFAVRVVKRATAAEALSALGELTDKVQVAARTEGGIKLKWKPKEAENTYTWYVELGEISGLPTANDEAAWTNRSPVVNVKLTCKPFGVSEERTIKSETESAAEPMQTLYVTGVKGDAPAETRVIVKDRASKERRFAQYGHDVVASESNPSLLITAGSLVTTGFTGESKTRAEAYAEEKVKRGVAVTQPTTLCSTGRIEHTGTFGVYLRVYAGSENVRFRVSYKNGDGPLVPLEWKQPPRIEAFTDIYMGEASLDVVELGTQTSEIRVELKSEGASLEADLNYISLIPTLKGSMKARGIASNEPTALKAYDEFNQSTGNLDAPKVLSLGGSWSEASKSGTAGFKIEETSHYAYRKAKKDADLQSGSYALAGTANYTSVQVSIDVDVEPKVTGGILDPAKQFYSGALLRYVDTSNWFMAIIRNILGSTGTELAVYKRAGGTTTYLASVGTGLENQYPHSITAFAGADGTWWATAASVKLSGADSALATGGTIASGKVGMYDASTVEIEVERSFDNFVAIGSEEAGRVCYSGKSMEFRSDGVLRQDSGGTYYGPPSRAQGANIYMWPAGDSEVINRLVTRMRRNDIEVEADPNVTDKHSVEVKVIERFLHPR